jgi:hypothetical protein
LPALSSVELSEWAYRKTIDGGVSTEPAQRQQPEGGPDHERWWHGTAVGSTGNGAAEEAAVQVEEERGAAGAGEARVRPAQLRSELRQRPRLRRPSLACSCSVVSGML